MWTRNCKGRVSFDRDPILAVDPVNAINAGRAVVCGCRRRQADGHPVCEGFENAWFGASRKQSFAQWFALHALSTGEDDRQPASWIAAEPSIATVVFVAAMEDVQNRHAVQRHTSPPPATRVSKCRREDVDYLLRKLCAPRRG